jgi:hypothetical protein
MAWGVLPNDSIVHSHILPTVWPENLHRHGLEALLSI